MVTQPADPRRQVASPAHLIGLLTQTFERTRHLARIGRTSRSVDKDDPRKTPDQMIGSDLRTQENTPSTRTGADMSTRIPAASPKVRYLAQVDPMLHDHTLIRSRVEP